MMHKMAIALLAAIVTAGAASMASARVGGGFHSFHGGAGPGMAAPAIHSHQFAGRFDHDRHFRHHRFGRFLVYGDAGYYDDCYARVWTRWGWRWQNVCY